MTRHIKSLYVVKGEQEANDMGTGLGVKERTDLTNESNQDSGRNGTEQLEMYGKSKFVLLLFPPPLKKLQWELNEFRGRDEMA